MSSPVQASQPENPTARRPDALLYDFEAVLRLVDIAIAELSAHELSSLLLRPESEHDQNVEDNASVESTTSGESEPV